MPGQDTSPGCGLGGPPLRRAGCPAAGLGVGSTVRREGGTPAPSRGRTDGRGPGKAIRQQARQQQPGGLRHPSRFAVRTGAGRLGCCGQGVRASEDAQARPAQGRFPRLFLSRGRRPDPESSPPGASGCAARSLGRPAQPGVTGGIRGPRGRSPSAQTRSWTPQGPTPRVDVGRPRARARQAPSCSPGSPARRCRDPDWDPSSAGPAPASRPEPRPSPGPAPQARPGRPCSPRPRPRPLGPALSALTSASAPPPA